MGLLEGWRAKPAAEQGYAPGNVVNLLRLLRGELCGLNLSRLALRQAYLAEVDAQDASLVDAHLLDTVLAEADTILLPGLTDVTMTIPTKVVVALRNAAAGGARIASICSGAFILAATGLLNGLRATTHWAAAGLLAQRYPTVEVDANVLFIDIGISPQAYRHAFRGTTTK